MKNKCIGSKKKINPVIVISLIFILSISAGCIESDEGKDLAFTTLDGNEEHLIDYQGKVVILNLMVPWETQCSYQMIELNKVYENYSRNDLEIISIDINTDHTPQDVQEYRKVLKDYDCGVNWTFGIDKGNIWKKYGREGIPLIICIFDQEGNLYFSHEGQVFFSKIPPGWPADTPVLAPKIDELLG